MFAKPTFFNFYYYKTYIYNFFNIQSLFNTYPTWIFPMETNEDSAGFLWWCYCTSFKLRIGTTISKMAGVRWIATHVPVDLTFNTRLWGIWSCRNSSVTILELADEVRISNVLVHFILSENLTLWRISTSLYQSS